MIDVQRSGRGRPLRFLAAVGVGWIGVRATLLWPDGVVPVGPIRLLIAPARAAAPAEAIQGPSPSRVVRRGVQAVAAPRPPTFERATRVPEMNASTDVRPPPAAPASPRPRAPLPGVPPFVAMPPDTPDRIPGTRSRAPRWSGSAWAVTRAGLTAQGDGTGGQLGGSQAGIRIVRTLDRQGRVALAGRLTTPLGAGLREASLGLEWQPTRLPLRLVAEQRFALGAGTGGPGIGMVGGFGPVPVFRGLRAESYAQAGVLRRTRTEPYADAALRLTHPVARIGGTRIELGAGTWGGAQRGAARLDIGPTLAVAVPVAGKTLRLTLDWRERVAGRAKPGSGPALTVGTDF